MKGSKIPVTGARARGTPSSSSLGSLVTKAPRAHEVLGDLWAPGRAVSSSRRGAASYTHPVHCQLSYNLSTVQRPGGG